MDREMKRHYTLLVDFLGKILGPDYEVALHELLDDSNEIIAIANGELTGRHLGSPLSNKMLEFLTSRLYETQDYVLRFESTSVTGKKLCSNSLFIKDPHGRLVGLLCINFYMNTSVFQFLQSMTPPAAQTPDSPVEESYVENVDELIVQAVTEASQKVQNDSAISNANKNKEIVSILYQRGIFNLKDAVVKVAGLMGISKNTVYMHVRNLNHG